MSFTIEDVDTSDLAAAQKHLDAVSEQVGTFESLMSAQMNLRDAVEAVEGEGSFERCMSDAVGCCHDAVDGIDDVVDLIDQEHRAGRIRASDDMVEYVVGQLRAALEAIDHWSSSARAELGSL